MLQRASHYLSWVVITLCLVIVILWWPVDSGFSAQAESWVTTIFGAGLIAFLTLFSVPTHYASLSLIHAIALPVGMVVSPGHAAIAIFSGMLLAAAIQQILYRREYFLSSNRNRWFITWSRIFARQMLSVSGALLVYSWLVHQQASNPWVAPSLGLAITFTLLYSVLFWLGEFLFQSKRPRPREMLVILVIALVPIPFVILVASSYALIEHFALIIYGPIIGIISVILRRLALTTTTLQRRIDELNTIGQVSLAIRTSLDLDSLLSLIYKQVSQLLDVENFYVALYDPEEDEMIYPLAIKNGKRQHWESRPLSERLTDRVIQTSSPILIPSEGSQALRQMGFPELDNAPEAWLGVPLQNPDRAIGCLAVFHTKPGRLLTEKDMEVLLTLSGQAAVAIENALLYQQTERRARALASLNEIAALMSSTLDPERALDSVGMSMIRVGGSQKSAIYLVDAQHAKLELAHSANLSREFIQTWTTIPLSDEFRSSCYHSGIPTLISNLAESNLPGELIEDMSHEGIGAFADFPLITPDGTIGQISVYFSEPQRFKPDQIELLRTFASQAALAVANARAHAATDEALQRRVEQLASLEAIGRELVATLNIDDLFQTILDAALDVTQAKSGRLAIYEEDKGGMRIVADKGYMPNSPVTNHDTTHPLDQGIEGKVFSQGSVQNISDISQIFDHRSWTGSTNGSLLSAPVMQQGRVLGVITLENCELNSFTSEDEGILQQLAAQAAVALTNAALYEQLEARLREQSLLYQASAQIAATLESRAVASAVADSLAVAIKADTTNVFRCDPTCSTLVGLASSHQGRPTAEQELQSIGYEQVPGLKACLIERKPKQWTLSTASTPADRRYLLEERKAGSIMALPLILGEKTLGMIEALANSEVEFDENAVRTAQTIGSQAAIALENTDLFLRISESRNRLMAVLNSTHEGMLLVDTTGSIALANNKLDGLIGYAVEDLVGKSMADPTMGIAARLGYRPGEIGNLLAALRSGEAVIGEEAEYNLETPSRRTLQRSEAPVHDAEGQLIGWLIVLRDVSEERELEEAQEQLTEMIVHDLRSPLTAILGSIKLLEKSFADEAQNAVVNQALWVSRRSVQQMLGLVNSLLDIAKLESGEIELDRDEVVLTSMCEDLVATYQPEANEEGIILELELAKNIPIIQADQEKIQRVLVNLLDNALKFTPEGGTVTIRVLPDSKKNIRIEIADTGPGIPEEFRQRIFERFSQVPGQIGRRRGTGLGLAFSKLAVDAHGGQIWIEDNPTGGSIFCIYLPIKSK